MKMKVIAMLAAFALATVWVVTISVVVRSLAPAPVRGCRMGRRHSVLTDAHASDPNGLGAVR